jgi:hypothetical protein
MTPDSVFSASVSHAVTQGMGKSGPEYYAFLLVALILGAICLVLWFQHRQTLQRAQAAGLIPDPDDKTRWIVSERRAPVRCDACVEIAGIEDKLASQIDHLGDKLLARIEVMEANVERTEKRQEDRLAAIERKMDDGFRAVHDRIDKHLEAHRPIGGR